MVHDLVIIGAGPAGISAAIHAKRFGLNFKLLERARPGGQALSANLIENYPGFPNGISGRELMGEFLKQIKRLRIKITKCEAKKIRKESEVFLIKTNKGAYKSRAVILAAGLKPAKLPFKRKIHYYPVPDDIPHTGKIVLVIGGGDSAFDEAISFSKKARVVTIAMRSKKPSALPKLVKTAKLASIGIKTGISDKMLAKMSADIVTACIGKERDLSILDSALRITNHDSRFTVLLAGDILHPDVRHIAAAVGDGVKAVENIWGARL